MRQLALKQLLREIALWCEHPHRDRELHLRLTRFLEKLRATAENARLDLHAEPLSPDFALLLQAKLQAYREVEQTLEVCAEYLRHNEIDKVRQQKACLDLAALQLMQHTEAVENWLTTPPARCPGCLASFEEDELCPDCGLEQLRPDPQPPNLASAQVCSLVLRLPVPYGTVFAAYRAVLSGEQPLRQLLEPLVELRNWLEDALLSAQPSAKEHVREALVGIREMERGWKLRSVAELNQGWLKIFAAALRLV